MASNPSVDFFLRFLQDRFRAFNETLQDLLRLVSLDDRQKKAEATKRLLVTLDDLKRAMSPNDHPSWIAPLESRLNWYLGNISNGDAGHELLKTILSVYGKIQAQNWNFEQEPAIDFGGIYEKHYGSSRVPQLFEELIGHLETIIKSGEIDSVQTIKALEKLIATIRKNARKDYFRRGARGNSRGASCTTYLGRFLRTSNRSPW